MRDLCENNCGLRTLKEAIQMIGKIHNNQIQDVLTRPSAKHSESKKALSDIGVDVSIQVDYASLINKANQIQSSDTEAIEQARKLLLAGKLESPRAIRAAAENMTILGI